MDCAWMQEVVSLIIAIKNVLNEPLIKNINN